MTSCKMVSFQASVSTDYYILVFQLKLIWLVLVNFQKCQFPPFFLFSKIEDKEVTYWIANEKRVFLSSLHCSHSRRLSLVVF